MSLFTPQNSAPGVGHAWDGAVKKRGLFLYFLWCALFRSPALRSARACHAHDRRARVALLAARGGVLRDATLSSLSGHSPKLVQALLSGGAASHIIKPPACSQPGLRLISLPLTSLSRVHRTRVHRTRVIRSCENLSATPGAALWQRRSHARGIRSPVFSAALWPPHCCGPRVSRFPRTSQPAFFRICCPANLRRSTLPVCRYSRRRGSRTTA